MLRASPAIADAVVSAVPDAAGGIRLVAHLVARADPPPAPRELRAFLATRLPAHMVPSAYAYLQALPATVNGKVDRAALPPPPAERAEASELYAAPRTRIEEKLADTWRELLGLDRIGIDDNFFELGGHSVLAIALHQQLRDSAIEMDVLDIFASPTIRTLASRITQGSDDAPHLGAAQDRAKRRRAALSGRGNRPTHQSERYTQRG